MAIPLLIQAAAYDGCSRKFPTVRALWAAPDGTKAHYPAAGQVIMHPLLVEVDKETIKAVEQSAKARRSEVDKKTTEAARQVREKLATLGLRPANLHELLCFGVVHKELQIKYNIVGLGSVTLDRDGSACYANLTGTPTTMFSTGVKGFGGATRQLSLNRFGHWIQTPLRFLAVPLPDPWSVDPSGTPVLLAATPKEETKPHI